MGRVNEVTEFKNYVEIIGVKLTLPRFEHSLRVAKTALQMAQGREVDKDKVYVAALLHDYAKDLSAHELLKTARDNNLIICEAEEMQPDLLHGPVGAWLCQKELGVKDKDIIRAIRFHTTGNRDMNMLDIIIYLADLIEPGRSYPGVNELRTICQNDLLRGLLYAFDCTLLYVLERELLIHHNTVEARNWLLPRIKANGGII